MNKLFIVVITLLSFVAPVNARPSIKIINTVEDSKTFLSDFEKAGNNKQEQIAAWNKFEQKYKQIFNTKVYDLEESRTRFSLDNYFVLIPKIKGQIMSLFPKAEKSLQNSEESFSSTFRNFKETDFNVKVYLTLMSVKTNGYSARDNKGNGIILIGIDGIIMQGQNEKDVEYLFPHELFHAYWGARHKNESTDSFDAGLWREGFATYASGVVAKLEDDIILSNPLLADRCKDPLYVKSLAKKYKHLVMVEQPKIMKTKDEKTAQNFFKEWFLNRKNATKKNPARQHIAWAYML